MKTNFILPLFTGFYDSIFCQYESWYESELDYLTSEQGMTDETATDYLDKCDTSKCNADMSETIAHKFEEIFNDTFKTKIEIEFTNLESPQYYNFSTDKILASITFNYGEILELILDNKQAFEKFLKDNFTSYDGFFSSYSNDFNDWNFPNLSEFDEVEMWTIFAFLCDLESLDSWSLYNYCDDLSEDFINNVEYPTLTINN